MQPCELTCLWPAFRSPKRFDFLSCACLGCRWALRNRAEMHQFPRFLGGRNFAAQFAHDARGPLDKLGIAHGEDALAEIDVILHADTDISAEGKRHRAQGQLIFPDAHHLPRRSLRDGIQHRQQVGGRRWNSTLDAENKAEMQGRYERASLDEIQRILDMAEVVDLQLIANAAFLATGDEFAVPSFRVWKMELGRLVLEMEGAEV